MYPPLFELANADNAVKALLGTSPLRFYLFGQAEQNTPKPYAVWQTAYGNPENYLAHAPDVDSYGIQIDVYALTVTAARNAADALRNCFQPHGYVVAWRGESKDVSTGNFNVSFDVEFFTER